MTIPTADQLIAALRTVPEGMTTRQVLERFTGAKLVTISGRLSKLAARGRIDREIMRRKGAEWSVPGRWLIWRVKEAAHVQD